MYEHFDVVLWEGDNRFDENTEILQITDVNSIIPSKAKQNDEYIMAIEKIRIMSYLEFVSSSGHQAFVSQTPRFMSLSFSKQFPVKIPA